MRISCQPISTPVPLSLASRRGKGLMIFSFFCFILLSQHTAVRLTYLHFVHNVYGVDVNMDKVSGTSGSHCSQWAGGCNKEFAASEFVNDGTESDFNSSKNKSY